MSLYERIENDFTYRVPCLDAVECMVVLRSLCKELAHMIDELVPDGREKSTALTNLEQVSMWSNAGIVRHER